ncbi:hypothetical protein BKA93DRAFT_458028 [Sparassis latifolia]
MVLLLVLRWVFSSNDATMKELMVIKTLSSCARSSTSSVWYYIVKRTLANRALVSVTGHSRHVKAPQWFSWLFRLTLRCSVGPSSINGLSENTQPCERQKEFVVTPMHVLLHVYSLEVIPC